MVNKQGLLFLTLTSLILVLSIYYVTMPNELLLGNNSNYSNVDNVSGEKDNSVNVDISESTTIETMRNLLNDERIKLTLELNNKLTDKEVSIDEKNAIYEELKYITKIESIEARIESKLKEEFGLASFVKIDDDVVEVVINSTTHNTNLVAKIMTSVQKEFTSKMYISVSFKE